jgi:hypothetical protein
MTLMTRMSRCRERASLAWGAEVERSPRRLLNALARQRGFAA